MAEHLQQHYSDEQKEQWLESVLAVARMCNSQTLHTSMMSSHLFMKNWLLQSNATASTASRVTGATNLTSAISATNTIA
jgi:hypothetical protein